MRAELAVLGEVLLFTLTSLTSYHTARVKGLKSECHQYKRVVALVDEVFIIIKKWELS